jgi:hypothetical protein
MLYHFALNARFNTVGGNLPLVNKEEMPSAATAQLSYIVSEMEELLEGIQKNDLKMIRDGAGDVIVTVDGMFHRIPVLMPFYPSLEEINLDLHDLGKEAAGRVDANSFVLKRVEAIRENLSSFTDLDFLKDDDDLKLKEFGTTLKRTLVICYKVSREYNFYINHDQRAIYDSNMSKYDVHLREAEEGYYKYKAAGVDTEIVPNEVDGITYYVIRSSRNQNDTAGRSISRGKILKSVNFHEPNLS